MTEATTRTRDCLAIDTAPRPLKDGFARTITYLRLSVTDRCDLRCAYCMPERMTFLPKREILSLEELGDLAEAFVARGVTKVRITGGEPLVRRDVMILFERLGARLGSGAGQGLEELTLTTNATRLEHYAEALAQAGVARVNVSLDTLDRTRFAKLARRDALEQVLAGIRAAGRAGLRVKINAVALADNVRELPDLIRWAHGEGHDVTLIEVMPLGDVDADRVAQYVPLTVVREKLEQRWTLADLPLSTGGPARYVTVSETGGRLGFITPHTNNFCAGCNRVRVTATGQLYPCLGGGERVDLRAALRSSHPAAALHDALDRAMQIKPERHDFRIGVPDATQPRHMSVTGG